MATRVQTCVEICTHYTMQAAEAEHAQQLSQVQQQLEGFEQQLKEVQEQLALQPKAEELQRYQAILQQR